MQRAARGVVPCKEKASSGWAIAVHHVKSQDGQEEEAQETEGNEWPRAAPARRPSGSEVLGGGGGSTPGQ